MADTTDDLPRLRLWLAQAEMAEHNLALGQLTVSAGYEGKSRTFTQTTRADLQVYINALRQRIALLEGVVIPRRAPIHLSF